MKILACVISCEASMTLEEHLSERPLETVEQELIAMRFMYGAYAGCHGEAGIELFMFRNTGRTVK